MRGGRQGRRGRTTGFTGAVRGRARRPPSLCSGPTPPPAPSCPSSLAPPARYLYVLDDALTTYSSEEGTAAGKRAPVPPCIAAAGADRTVVLLEVDDRASRPALLKVTADYVRLAIKAAVTAGDAEEEVVELMRTVLGALRAAAGGWRGLTLVAEGWGVLVGRCAPSRGGAARLLLLPPCGGAAGVVPSRACWLGCCGQGRGCSQLLCARGRLSAPGGGGGLTRATPPRRLAAGVRLSQLAVERGEDARHKRLVVQGMAPDAVFGRLNASLRSGGGAAPGGRGMPAAHRVPTKSSKAVHQPHRF